MALGPWSDRLRAIRPLEWALLAFVAFAVLRAGPGVLLEFRELAGQRTVTVFWVLGLVMTIALGREAMAAPWPVGTEGFRRLHRGLGLLAVSPSVASLALAVSSGSLRAELVGMRLAQVLPVLATLGVRIVGYGLPTTYLWLAAELELKRGRRFTPPRFRQEGRWQGLFAPVVNSYLLLRHVAQFLAVPLRALGVALREWAPLLLIISAYAWMDAVTGGKVGEGRDAWMAAADRALFGGVDPLDLAERAITPALSEWLAFVYSFYAVLYPLVLGAVLMLGGRRAIRETSFLVGAALLLSYVSYSLVPVKGPVLARAFAVPLDLYYIGALKEALMDANRITWDCFPSMHTCCTVLLTYAALRHTRKLGLALLPIAVSMPVACVYLRYHYVVDVLAGLALAPLMVWLTARLRGRLLADLPAP